MAEVLYVKNKDLFKYYEITIIKPDGWKWGPGELDTNVFGILKTEVTKEQITAKESLNAICINDTQTAVTATAEKYKRVLDTKALDEIPMQYRK